jgi:mRNA-degrading endonuclease YafQ of YafQ-DinJ toxin-antitoxin module
MLEIAYTPSFIRMFKRLEPALREEVQEKIAVFQDTDNHQRLRVHKLTGRLSGQYSFSVNYAYRIVFMYGESKQEAILLAVGDHDVYKK